MPTKTKTKTPAGPESTLQYLNVDDIAPHPKNPRHNLGDLKELTASIAEQGVLEAIVVEPFPEGDEIPKDGRSWLLIHGHRRLAAAQAAGLATIKAEVLPAASTLEDQVARMLVENLQRAGLTAVEEGDAYQELLDLGWDTATISQRVSRPKTKVAALVKVAGLPESARERIDEGQLTLEDAQRMAKFAKDTAAIDKLQKAADVSRWQFDNELSRIEREQQQAREATKTRKHLQSLGISVMTSDEFDQLPDNDDILEIEDLPSSARGDADDLDRATYEGDYDTEWQRRAVAAHASCPGAVSVVEPGWVQHFCTRAALHPADSTEPGPGLTDEEAAAARERDEQFRKDREEAEKARAELKLNLAAAGTARRHWLAAVITAPEADQVARALLIARFDGTLKGKNGYAADKQRILGEIVLPNATADSLDRPGLADRISKALATMPIIQLALVAELHGFISEEDSLSRRVDAWTDNNSWNNYASYRKALTKVWGYTWSQLEQELVDGEKTDF